MGTVTLVISGKGQMGSMKLLELGTIDKYFGKWIIPFVRKTRRKTIKEKMSFVDLRTAVKRYHKLEKVLNEQGGVYMGKQVKKKLNAK
jgi:hypothetical protein